MCRMMVNAYGQSGTMGDNGSRSPLERVRLRALDIHFDQMGPETGQCLVK
jgi:hypothetical protein